MSYSPPMVPGDGPWQLRQGPYCSASDYAKPCGSEALILSWLEAELVSSARRASWRVSCYSPGRNFSWLRSVCLLPAKLAGGCRACSPFEKSRSELGPSRRRAPAPIRGCSSFRARLQPGYRQTAKGQRASGFRPQNLHTVRL